MTATAARRGTTRNGNKFAESADPSLHEENRPAEAPAAEQAAAGSGRDTRGRFTAGNARGPGNPFARQTAQLRSALIQRVTIEDINVIADELILRARCGQLEAIKLLLQYVIGKPTAAVNPDTLDVEEFQQVYAPRKEMMEVAPEITQGLPPHVLSTLVQVTNDACGQQMGKILSSGPEGISEAQKNLGAFFGGAKVSEAAKPQTQEDADTAEAAAVWRILNGEEDDVDPAGEEALSPSTKRFDGSSGGDGNSRQPSINGKRNGKVPRPRGPASGAGPGADGREGRKSQVMQ